MVNENHFRFDHKSFFNFRKNRFKTVNRFSKLNYSSLHACLISDHQNLAIIGCRNRVGAGVRQHPVAGILSAPESGHRRTKFRPNLAGSGRFRLLAGFRSIFLNGDRTFSDSGDICQTLIFAFRNFFVRTKHRKIFSRKSFFLKMISSKSFYVETNGTLMCACFLFFIA